ncbi:MAG: diguanylate cyclase [Magnetospirillum sp. WYHS-4]
MLPRLTRKAFRDLAIWMVGFGLVAGIAFPFFVMMLGVAREQTLTPMFFAATLVAGLMVGAVNFGLAHLVFRPRLRLLSTRMRTVETALREAIFTGDASQCDTETCLIPVDSHDEIGESARSFNELVATLTRAREVENAVRTFSRALSSHLDFNPLTQAALDMLLEHTGAAAGAILAEIDGDLRTVANHGLRDTESLAGSDHVRRALRLGESQHLKLPPDVHVEGALTDFRPREVLVVPIEYNQVNFGVAILATTHTFAADIVRLLALFGQGMGLALHNSMAHDRLQRLAAIDPMTGLYNRRFGQTRLREEFTRAMRQGGDLGLLIFDIDHFKKVNDTYGHLVGDRVLVRVTEAARRAFREGDILVRYGGEEFYAIMPGASLKDVREIGERLRHIVQDTIVKDGDQELKVTISVGVTAFPPLQAEDEEALVRRADEALYQAKRNGRNQVQVGT